MDGWRASKARCPARRQEVGELLAAAPEAVLQFLNAMRRGAPESLVGIAWFRLPTDADSRAWSLQTWRAVIAGELPAARLSAGLVPAERADLWTVTLSQRRARRCAAAAPGPARSGVRDGRRRQWIQARRCRRPAGPRGDRQRPAARRAQAHHRLGALH